MRSTMNSNQFPIRRSNPLLHSFTYRIMNSSEHRCSAHKNLINLIKTYEFLIIN